jgi:bacteriorhodopsin
MSIRYSDWIITLPLLLVEIFLICGIDIGENLGWFLLTCTFIFLMLLAGWMALKSFRKNPGKSKRFMGFILTGCFCLAAVYWIVLGQLDHTKTGTPLQTVAITLFLAWSLYGIVAVMQSTGENGPDQYMYDLLDLATKAIFGIIVASDTLYLL